MEGKSKAKGVAVSELLGRFRSKDDLYKYLT